MTLLEELKQAAAPAPPKDFAPGVIYAGRRPDLITTPAMPALEGEEDWDEAVKSMGVPIPDGYRLQLVEALFAGTHNPAAWQRDPADKGVNHTAYTAENTTNRWRYKFKVVLKSLIEDDDYAAMMKEAAKKVRARKPLKSLGESTMVINLADFQVGKDDLRGGSQELLDRNADAMDQVETRIKVMRPSRILLVDPGDSTEGFNSAPAAERTNDLQETEALTVWRRIFWRWIEMVAKFRIPVEVISVPSNHCRNRKGKQELGPVDDDWGLHVLGALYDMAQVNPDAYGHVTFTVPQKHEEHVTLTLPGGKVLSVAHGHKAPRPEAVIDWAKKQGRRSIGQSDILVVGHFHHFRAITYGDNQTLFICPTMDAGSAYYTAYAGEASDPGVLTFMVDERGWRDLFVAWT